MLKKSFLRLVKLQASIAEARNAMDEIVANIDGLVHDEGQLALVRQMIHKHHAAQHEPTSMQVRESEQLATSLACLQEEKAATMRGRGTGAPARSSEHQFYTYGRL